MTKPFINLLVLLLCPFAAAVQESRPPDATTPDSFTIPAGAVHQVNPVKPTAESIAQGKKYYGYDCAMCHGNSGDGKGEVAIDEKLTLSNFSDRETLKNKTDEDLFYVIKNGHGHMPPERIRLSPNELWNLVNYIRSLPNPKAQ